MKSFSQIDKLSFPLVLVRKDGKNVSLLRDEEGLTLLPFDTAAAEKRVVQSSEELEGLTLEPLKWSLDAKLTISLQAPFTKLWLLLLHMESGRRFQLSFDALGGAPKAALEQLDWDVQGHMQVYLVCEVPEAEWVAEVNGGNVKLADEEQTHNERLLVANNFKELVAVLSRTLDTLLTSLVEEQTVRRTAIVYPEGFTCPVNVHCWDDALRRKEHECLLLRRGGFLHAAQRVRAFPISESPAEGQCAVKGSSGLDSPSSPKPKWHAHLVSNIHLESKPPNPQITGAETHLVSGTYDYYHYRVDGFKDDGWGCAYRSLQTVLSWFIHQGYVSAEVPSNRQIQQILFAADPDKMGKKNFVGSNDWIGSFEIMLVLQHYMPGLDCLIKRMESGAALDEDPSVQSLLLEHFRQPDAPPVMIGGSNYAHTILGVYMNPLTMEAQYLVLDPHYSSETTVVKKAVSSGYIGWKKASSFFEKKSWYNMCIPQAASFDPR